MKKNLLAKYQKKRNFSKTKEPKGKVLKTNNLRFVIQKHDATRLHYDFRIEHDGVLKSWAVPKGLPYKNSEKHLAMHVEDHPLHYYDFEGIIEEGNYGAGSVIVWDSGNYWVPHAETKQEVSDKIEEGFKKGEIKLILNGRKVKGMFALVRFKKAGDNGWLFIKDKDEYEGIDFNKKEKSVKTGRTLDQVEEEAKEQKETDLKFIKPMLATLGDGAFDDENYIFEEKLDGYRVIATVDHGNVQLYSRRGESLNKKFSRVVKELEKLKIKATLDGEVVAYDKKGEASFQSLQNASDESVSLRYHIFDILNLNDLETTNLPLIERKNFLKKLFPKSKKSLLITKFIKEKGKDFFKKTKGEGIIAKKIDSIYTPGERTPDWIKIKNQKRQEFVIGGITEPKGNRNGFGSLLVGYYKGKDLVYCGHIGTGFDQKLINNLMKTFQKIKRKTSPFSNFNGEKKLQYFVDPVLVCEATFAEWTNDGMIRQASFEGIRADKPAKHVELESSAFTNSSQNKEEKTKLIGELISNPEKIFFKERKYTKSDLAVYYQEIAPILLQYLKDRPQNLNRHPNGYNGMHFYQKDIEFELPNFVETIDVKRPEPKVEQNKSGLDKEITYIMCQNVETLLFMVNLGCIEINPWLSRKNHLDSPDFMIFDIDPNKVEFKTVVEITKELYQLLENIGISPAIKTSGKRGIHLYTNVGAKYSHEETRSFAEAIARLMEARFPDKISLERSPKNRKGKIYIDYLQNRIGQTTASVYSCRPTKDASVSTPIEFEELNAKLDPSQFTIKNTLKRIERKGDLWAKMFENEVNLKEAVKRLKSL